MPPNHWPSPSFFEHLLYESPWALVCSLAVVGIALHLLGAQRQQIRVQRAAIVLFFLALGALILSNSVETDRETILRRTREFIAAAKSPQDTDTLNDSISDFATFQYFDADDLRQVIQEADQLINIDSYRVTNTLARIDRPGYGSTYAAGIGRGSFRNNTAPFKTQFILKWRKDDDQQWRITEIVEFDINGQTAMRYLRMIGRR